MALSVGTPFYFLFRHFVSCKTTHHSLVFSTHTMLCCLQLVTLNSQAVQFLDLHSMRISVISLTLLHEVDEIKNAALIE